MIKVKHPEKYAKWGIINKNGDIVLPVVYDDIWNFYGRNQDYITVEKDGDTFQIYFSCFKEICKAHRNWIESLKEALDDDYMSHSWYRDSEGFWDEDLLEDAYLDGEWVDDDIWIHPALVLRINEQTFRVDF